MAQQAATHATGRVRRSQMNASPSQEQQPGICNYCTGRLSFIPGQATSHMMHRTRTCCQRSTLLGGCQRQRRMQRAPDVGDRANAVACTAEFQRPLLQVQGQRYLTLVVVELEEGPRLALVARCGAAAGFSDLLPVVQVGHVEVLAWGSGHCSEGAVQGEDVGERASAPCMRSSVHGTGAAYSGIVCKSLPMTLMSASHALSCSCCLHCSQAMCRAVSRKCLCYFSSPLMYM